MTDKNHPTGVAQCAGEPVVWVSFTERGYVRFWTTDKTRAVAEMAAGSFAVRPYTVDDLMGMVVRASAAQPPAAPVESGRMAIAEIIGGKIFNDIPDVIPGAATRYAREDALKKADAILALVSRSSAANAADILMAAKALDYLSDHSRPNGGQENYNAEHLVYLAEKLRKLAAHLTNEPQATRESFDRIISALRYDGPDENSLTVGEIRRALP